MGRELTLGLLVTVGGAVGSLLRYGVVRLVTGAAQGEFPWGVATVNLVGSFLMGVLVGGLLSDPNENHLWRALLAVGLLGGFTTFSAFSLDLVRLLDRGELVAALAYVGISIFGGLGSLLLGRYLVKHFTPWFLV